MENWTIDQKERALVAREAAIAVLRAEQVEIVADLDRAQVATADGARSMVEWVAARCDVAPATARNLVAAATLLADRPALQAEVAEGRVSFDRALATARLAAAGASARALEASRGYAVAGVHRLAAAHRRMTPKDEQQAFAGRHLHLQPSLDRSHWRMWGELPGVDGETVDAVLSLVADQMPDLPDGTRPGLGQRRADALVSVCDRAADEPTGEHRRRPPTVAVFVDAHLAANTRGEAGVATASGVRIGPEALQGVLCDAGIELTAVHDGRPVMHYRRTRTTPHRLRQYGRWRDGGVCAVDGCQSRYRLQPHHIVPRAEGGTDDPDDLALLCWFHHHVVVHGMGYRIDPESPPQRRRFLRPQPPEP